MTAFPTAELPQLPALATLPRKVRAIAVDSAVAENRRNTLPGDAEKRATPRLSIAELNASSLDDIRDKWARTRVDDRGPLTRFLDLLDLPRNTIATILAPSVAARKKASGETGALGMGVVRTADILDDLGVDNRVVRGVAGFVGDVALDPLTYIGPAGWGAKLTGTARVAKGLGATVQITKRGLKTARAAIENPVSAAGDIGEWLRLSGATTREAAQAAMGGNLRAKGVGAKAWRFLGDDISQGGSRLIDDAMTVLPEDPTEWAKLGYTANDVQRIKAAKRFVTAHNRAAQPGVRIGRNATGRIGIEVGSGPGTIKAGTQWAHIPFTDYALSGPAISSGARLGLRNERVVQNLYANAKDMQAIDQIQSGIKPIIDNIEEINRRAESHMDDIKATEAARVKAQEAMAAGDPAAAAEFARLDSVLKATEDGGGGSLVDLAAQANSEAKSAIDQLNLIIARSRQTGDLSEAAQLYLAQHIIPGLRAKAAETAARFKVANAEAAYDKSVFQTGFNTEGQKQPGMTEYVDKQVANSVAEQKAAHDKAEAARVAAHPESGTFDYAEIGAGQTKAADTSEKALTLDEWLKSDQNPFGDFKPTRSQIAQEYKAYRRRFRGKSFKGETKTLAEDPADKVWRGEGRSPYKQIRFQDPTAQTPVLFTKSDKTFITDVANAADDALPTEAQDAITEFVGHRPHAVEKDGGFGFGIMNEAKLEDAYGPSPSSAGTVVREQIDSAMADVRDKLRNRFGPTVRLYRHQGAVESGSKQRNVLSWSFNEQVANDFSGAIHARPITDEQIARAIAEFESTGTTKINGYVLKKSEEWPGQADIYQAANDYGYESYIMGDDPKNFLSGLKENYLEIQEINKPKLARILVADVPVDDIVWITDRAGQHEAIVKTYGGKTRGILDKGDTRRGVHNAAEAWLVEKTGAPRTSHDRKMLLGYANAAEKSAVQLDPAKIGVGDSWSIGANEAEVIAADGQTFTIKVTPPGTQGSAVVPGEVVDYTANQPRYYVVPADKPLPATPGSYARAGGGVLEAPRPKPFDEAAAKTATAAKEWTEYRAKIQNAVYRNISDMSEGGIEARAAYADTLHQLAKAHEELAAATGAPLVQAMTSDDLIRRDIAALAVGANPEEIGGNPLASMAAVAEAIEKKIGNKHARETLDTLAGSVGKKFGNKSPSTAHDISRAINSANDMKSELVNQITTGIMADAQRLADLHDAKPSDVTTLMSVVAHATSGDIPIKPGDPIFEQLQYLAGKGYFKQGKGMTQSLYADTKALADKWKGALDELAKIEIDAGRLSGKMAEEYGFSNVMTPEAQQLIREQKANQLIGKGAANAKRVSAEEYFTKRRGTIEHTVKIGDKDVTFTEGDRIYSDWSDDDIKLFAEKSALNASAAQNIRNRRDAIKIYDAMPPGTQPPGRAMSPVEINMRAERGEYNALTGGLRIPIMVQDAAVSAGYRFWAAERSKLMQQAMEFVKPYTLDLNSDTLQRVVNTPDGNQVAHFKNGIQGRLYKTPTGDQRIRIGDVVYRAPKLDADAPHLWNPGELLGNDPNSYLPDKLATMVENLVGIVKNDNDAIGVTKLIELTTKIWKASTLFHPSWTINDTIGNLIFMLNMGISPAEIAKHAKDAFKVAYHNNFAADKLNDLDITLRGSPAKGIDAIHAAVQKKGAPAEAVMDVIGLGMYDVSGRIKLKGRFKEGVKELYTERARQAIYRSQAQTINQLPWSKKLQAGAKVALHDGIRDRVWAPWLSMNGVANDWMRTTAYMAMLDRGMDPTSAARAVSEGMLDMGDLTGFEKKIRKFIPFYQWTKNSGIYAMKQLFQNPKFYTLAPHAKRAIEEAIDGEQRIPEHMRPSWMRDAMAIQFGTDPNSRKMLLAQQALPNEAGAYMALLAGSPVLGQEALADALGYFGNALTPLLKAPLEIGQGSEWFSGRTIGPYGDVTAGEHLVGQIRLAKELGVGTGVRSGGLETAYKTGGAPAVAARALIGGRIQPGDERRLTTGLQRTAQEKETGLRRRIALAEREGDKEASLKARMLLLRHYQQMEQKGLKIPKWAAAQVQEVGR